MAAKEYATKYSNGFPPGLATLGPAPKGSAVSCNAAGLIEAKLATGHGSGYVFYYVPGASVSQVATGCARGVKTYTINARPIKYGRMGTGERNFFTDESGAIRFTRENRAATAQDPPLH